MRPAEPRTQLSLHDRAACGSSSAPAGGGGDGVIRQYVLQAHAPDKASMFKTLLNGVQSCAPSCFITPRVDDHVTSFTYAAPRYELGDPKADEPEKRVEFWQLPSDSAGGLNVTQGINIGASAGAGIGPIAAIDQAKGVVLSGSVSGSISASSNMVAFMDLNGDGLPDQVVSLGNQAHNATASSLPIQPAFGSAVAFNTGAPGPHAFRRAPTEVSGDRLDSDYRLFGPVLPPPVLSQDLSVGLSVGANLHAGLDYLGADVNAGVNTSISASLAFPTDVNGDGLVDFAGPMNLIQRRSRLTVDGGVAGRSCKEGCVRGSAGLM